LDVAAAAIRRGTMQFSIEVEPTPESRFRARGPFSVSVEAGSPEEAVERARTMVEERLAAGAQVITVHSARAHPWAPFAGTLADDPLYDEWVSEMAQYRREREADPDLP
jgi:hypothetical protein